MSIDIQACMEEMSDRVFDYIRDTQSLHAGGWVPRAAITDGLELKYVCYPKDNGNQQPQTWLTAMLCRILEDQSRVEFKRIGRRTFYRIPQP